MSANMSEKDARRLLTPASGYLTGYSHTLNPYAGCAFACRYCYVRQSPVGLFRGEDWGTWVDIKRNAPQLLVRELTTARRKGSVTLFMSSSTDPYQPAEAKAKLTRELLVILAEEPPDFLFVQTRSPLVVRDIDLLKRLGDCVRVSMTVETDRKDVHRVLTPAAPPIAPRLRALAALRDAGIPAQAAVAPLLPCTDDFPALLRRVTGRVCLDTFAWGDGSGGKRSERLGIRRLLAEHGWGEWMEPAMLEERIPAFREAFGADGVRLGKAGFMPD